MFRYPSVGWPALPVRRVTAILAALVAGACGNADAPDPETLNDAAAVIGPSSIADVGLSTPESVLYEPAGDVYLVSNINGAPLDRDDNGFITRLRPDGTVDQLKWIDGAAAEVTLHAPKGMAFWGDTLFVADIDSVRVFNRRTGAPLGARGVAGASFLNDLAVGPDGTLYVTDSGLSPTFQPTGRAALYRYGADGWAAVARGDALMAPNGIVVDRESVLLVPFGGNTVMRIPAAGGEPTTVATLPAGQLDGIVRLGDGSLLVSSWETQTVYRVSASGTAVAAVEGVEAPADIGFDTKRALVLIPLFNGNRIELRPIH